MMSHAKHALSAALVFTALAWAAASLTAEDAEPFANTGKIRHSSIAEASGLVANSRHSNVFWTVCDSGNLPHLFAIDRMGGFLAEFALDKTMNLDWESIASDGKGKLYIADVGNNLLLPRRWVIEISEPKLPTAKPQGNGVPVIKPLAAYHYGFESAPFDVEGTFAWNGWMYLFSKVRAGTTVYRLRLKMTEDQSIPKLEKVCDVPGIQIVTGADISDDGRYVAVCSYREAAIYEWGKSEAGALAAQPLKRIPFVASGIESCAWDEHDLLLVSEDGSVYRMRLR